MNRSFLPLLCGLAFSTVPVSAATVGYWRFEGDLTDSSGSGNNLTAVSAITTTALAGSGATSAFSNPVPQTGASNGNTSTGYTGVTNRGLYATDAAGFDFSGTDTFTIEAMFNITSLSATTSRVIAAQWAAPSNQRSWLFGVNTSGQLFLNVSENGDTGSGTFQLFTSSTVLSLNTDYYGAISFSLDANGVTLYLKDLTSNGTLTSVQFTASSLNNVHNSTAAFTIGGYANSATGANSTFNSPFAGSIDEVRLSNTVLGQSELLITPVPEPSTCALLALGAVLFLFFTRRRSQGRRA